MTRIHHLNCVNIESPFGAQAIGHCLLLETYKGLALIEAGIGLADMRQPEERLSNQLIEQVGFRFDEQQTAVQQIENLGFSAQDVRHCILTHLDPDHIGGLADFPHLPVHVSQEELINFQSGNARYRSIQLDHQPTIHTYAASHHRWYGLEARKIVWNLDEEIYLIPLPGHTLGHCGVALQHDNGWLLHVGDAYYYRIELQTDQHPVSQLAALRADDNGLRLRSLEQIRGLIQHHSHIETLSYHDPAEFVYQA